MLVHTATGGSKYQTHDTSMLNRQCASLSTYLDLFVRTLQTTSEAASRVFGWCVVTGDIVLPFVLTGGLVFMCRFQQAELVHSRWAMTAVVGILVPEV